MKCLVSGGGGFLGFEICSRLRARGDEVISVSRTLHPALDALGVRSLAIELNEDRALAEALRGVDTVFHTAAKAGVWGRREEFWRTNVDGSVNLLAHCRRAGVRRFVFSSSPSVTFDGSDHVHASNDLPQATRFLAAYPESKAVAERRVLEAHGMDGMSTVALRPHLIIGVRDPHLVPRLLARARAGKLAIIGAGFNEVTLCPVENAAHAHLLAADALSPDAPHAGRAYFIGCEEPVKLWVWIQDLLKRAGVAPIRRKIPAPLAYGLGGVCELAWRGMALGGEPPMTRFVAAQLSRSHSFDMRPAQRDFGYRELITLEESTAAIVAALRG